MAPTSAGRDSPSSHTPNSRPSAVGRCRIVTSRPKNTGPLIQRSSVERGRARVGKARKTLAKDALRMREGRGESHAARVPVPLVQAVVVAREPAVAPAMPIAHVPTIGASPSLSAMTGAVGPAPNAGPLPPRRRSDRGNRKSRRFPSGTRLPVRASCGRRFRRPWPAPSSPRRAPRARIRRRGETAHAAAGGCGPAARSRSAGARPDA